MFGAMRMPHGFGRWAGVTGPVGALLYATLEQRLLRPLPIERVPVAHALAGVVRAAVVKLRRHAILVHLATRLQRDIGRCDDRRRGFVSGGAWPLVFVAAGADGVAF